MIYDPENDVRNEAAMARARAQNELAFRAGRKSSFPALSSPGYPTVSSISSPVISVYVKSMLQTAGEEKIGNRSTVSHYRRLCAAWPRSALI